MASQVPPKIRSHLDNRDWGLTRKDGEGRVNANLQEFDEEDWGEIPQTSDCFQVEEEGGQHEEERHGLRPI